MPGTSVILQVGKVLSLRSPQNSPERLWGVEIHQDSLDPSCERNPGSLDIRPSSQPSFVGLLLSGNPEKNLLTEEVPWWSPVLWWQNNVYLINKQPSVSEWVYQSKVLSQTIKCQLSKYTVHRWICTASEKHNTLLSLGLHKDALFVRASPMTFTLSFIRYCCTSQVTHIWNTIALINIVFHGMRTLQVLHRSNFFPSHYWKVFFNMRWEVIPKKREGIFFL